MYSQHFYDRVFTLFIKGGSMYINNVKVFIEPFKDKYITNIQSHKGKGNISFEIETTNPYDNEAILIKTIKRDNSIVKLGYVQKKEFIDRQYTKAASELYFEYQDILCENGGDYNDPRILELKSNPKWAENTGNIYNELHSKEELEQIKSQIDMGIMNFVYDYYEDCGYLILNI